MSGGDRPSGGEAVAEWSDPATAMLTTTASSRPESDRLPPVDHLDSIHDAFSYGGVRDTLRNTMEYHLGLEPEQWGYWAQAEPHGMGAAESDEIPGVNACYTHLHIGVYFDASVTPSLRDVGSELERVIDKHVEVCEPAGFDAHDYTEIDDYLRDDDGCISLNGDVDNLGSYLAAYMGGYTEELLEKPIEYLAWGAVYWSAARRRTSRSKIVNESIRADRCEQRAESDQSNQTDSHGERVEWNDGRGLDVVCGSCGSGWSIDQDRLSEPVSDDDLEDALEDEYSGDHSPDQEPSLRDQWPSADSAFSVGESLRHKAIRDRVLSFIEIHGASVSLPQILGQLNIDPKHRDFVQKILDGEREQPHDSFSEPKLVDDDWELIAIVDSDGEEHSPGGGGVDMVSLHMPHRQLLEQTRLRHDLVSGEKFRCEKCHFSTHDHTMMARHLVGHDLTEPMFADHVLKVEDYYNQNRSCMEKPAPP
jgi:hypothetical protein